MRCEFDEYIMINSNIYESVTFFMLNGSSALAKTSYNVYHPNKIAKKIK